MEKELSPLADTLDRIRVALERHVWARLGRHQPQAALRAVRESRVRVVPAAVWQIRPHLTAHHDANGNEDRDHREDAEDNRAHAGTCQSSSLAGIGSQRGAM